MGLIFKLVINKPDQCFLNENIIFKNHSELYLSNLCHEHKNTVKKRSLAHSAKPRCDVAIDVCYSLHNFLFFSIVFFNLILIVTVQ